MPDSKARIDIVKKLDKNLFVIAGAGSGKTSMLVNRMVSLIENGIQQGNKIIPVTIDKICAITFTVNAAAEFLKRLRETLARRAAGISAIEDGFAGGLGPITPQIQEADKIALQNIDLCFAGTMDAFCNLALSEYPLNANIPSSASVLLDESEIDTLYKKEYTRLSQKYKNDDRFKMFISIFKNPAKAFANSIGDVIEASYLDIQYVKPTKPIDKYVADFKTKYESDVQKDFDELAHSEQYLITVNTQNNIAKGVELYDKFIKKYKKYLYPWKLEDVFDLVSLRSIFKEELKFTAQPCANRCLSFSPNKKVTSFSYDENCSFSLALKEAETAKWSYAMDFLVLCANEIREELKKQGKLTFSEYLYIFKELVKDDAKNHQMKLIEHIRSKFSYFLIDESQDTSPFQYELFLYLCAKKYEDDKKDLDLLPGSLFIVGDPKQSIYRFRNADIDSYNDIKDIFENPKNKNNMVVELTNNYRSTSMLCNYFNRQFSNIAGISSIYTNITNANTKNPDGEGLYTFTDLVDVIKTIVNNPNYKILKTVSKTDESGNKVIIKEPCVLNYDDIMVITKSKKDVLSKLAKQLDTEDIPYFTEGDNKLFDYSAVETLYAIYCYLAYPTQNRFFFNLLTSPLFGLKKEEAVGMSNLSPALSKSQLAILDDIEQYESIDNPIILLKTIIDCILFKYVSSQRMDYVYYILNKLEDAFASNQVTTLDDGAIFLLNLINAPQERIAQMKYKPNAVYVANVHKVKGLEKPVVIICKSGTNYNTKSSVTKHLDYADNKSYVFRLAKSDYGFNNYEISDPYTYSSKLDIEDAKLKEEFYRLEYVAVTRARNYLFIEKSPSDTLKNNCWLNMVDDQFDEFVVANNTSNASLITATRPSRSLNTANLLHNVIRNTYEVVLPSKLAINHNGTSNITTIPNKATNEAAEKGTLLHALLEIYVLSGMKYSNSDAVEETLARYHQTDSDEYRQLLTIVINTMTSGGFIQESGQKEDLFAILKNASEIYCEYPFSYLEGDKLYNGTIDLLYKLNGQYYVVDYKTNYDGSNLTNIYQYQLNAYVKALKETANLDAGARIYHIDIK